MAEPELESCLVEPPLPNRRLPKNLEPKMEDEAPWPAEEGGDGVLPGPTPHLEPLAVPMETGG